MGCLLIILSVITPRLVLFLLWILPSNYLDRAYGWWFWPTLGFFVAPTTTLAYAVARNAYSAVGGGIETIGVVIIVVGVVLDLGLFGAGARSRRRT
jgi:hypothetical protein